jgi:hypothetical protein
MEYICDIEESDFPCKFFVFNVGINTTVRMTQFKHLNTYLKNINPAASKYIYKPKNPKNPVFRIKHGEFIYEDDDEKPKIDWDLTEDFPRVVDWDAKLL